MASAHEVDVLIAGGGPAGMLLGLLLARQGVRALVVERHADFAREYRGEVLMPRFTQIVQALGLYDRICSGTHKELLALEVFFRDRRVARVPFARVCPEVPFAIWMPQPVLLELLREAASRFATFELWFGADVRELLEDDGDGDGDGDGRCRGARVRRDGELIDVRASVTVGADGRFSSVRRLGGFEVEYMRHDFDVLWFTIPEPDGWPAAVRGFLTADRAYLALPKHPASIQCGMLLPADGYGRYHEAGIDALRRDLLAGPTLIHDFARQLCDFDPFVLLQAKLDLIERWAKDGLLLIGDAAHTCSPAGAIGVAVAIHTAAVAAEVIPRCLGRGDVGAAALGEVQRLRERDVRRIHVLQGRLGRPVSSRLPLERRLIAAAACVASRLGILPRALRRLVVLDEPFRPDRSLVAGADRSPTG